MLMALSCFVTTIRKEVRLTFLIEKGNTIIPLELKSGKSYKRHLALAQLMASNAFRYHQGIVLCNSNVEIENKIVYFSVSSKDRE